MLQSTERSLWQAPYALNRTLINLEAPNIDLLVQLFDLIELPTLVKPSLLRRIRAEVHEKVLPLDRFNAVVNGLA